jgi:hypothetical protein
MHDQAFRDLMSAVCAPVTVVTTADEDGPHGTTVSAFASLSLRPPLVTVALDRRSGLLGRWRRWSTATAPSARTPGSPPGPATRSPTRSPPAPADSRASPFPATTHQKENRWPL